MTVSYYGNEEGNFDIKRKSFYGSKNKIKEEFYMNGTVKISIDSNEKIIPKYGVDGKSIVSVEIVKI